MKTELLLLANTKKIKMLGIVLPYIRKNVIECGEIIVAANKSCKAYIRSFDGIKFMDEDKIFQNLTYQKVKRMMKSICGDGGRAGWYFQQFLKMAWSLYTDSDAYIVWDIDTIPLHKIAFQNSKGGGIFLLLKWNTISHILIQYKN